LHAPWREVSFRHCLVDVSEERFVILSASEESQSNV